MKKIFLIIGFIFIILNQIQAQEYYIIQKIDSTKGTVENVLVRVGSLEDATTDIGSLKSQLTNINNTIIGINLRLDYIDDSVGVHRTEIDALKEGGVVIIPEPSPPTNLIATATGSTTIDLSVTAPTSVYDSIYFYWQVPGALQWTYLTAVDSGVTTYTHTNRSPSTIYNYTSRSVKRVGGLALFSNYSNEDTALTAKDTPPIVPPSAGWTYDYIVSPWGGDGTGTGGVDTLTLSEALNLDGTLISGSDYADTFFVAIGVYNISSSINFNAANCVWRGVVAPADEKIKDANGLSSSVFTIVPGSQATITMGASGVKLNKLIFEQTASRYMFYVSAANCITDSVAFKYTIDPASSSHLIQVNGTGDDFLMTRCWVNDGPRCSLWIRWSGTTVPDNVIIEHTYFTAASNHNAIQFMPSTETSNCNWANGSVNPTPATRSKNATVRYCTFENNSYSDVLVFRHCDSAKVYGNLFINSGKICWDQYPYDVVNSPGSFDTSSVGFFAYNTIIRNGAFSIQEIGMFGNQNTNGLIVKNNIFYHSTIAYSAGLILRNEFALLNIPGQDRIDLRHQYDYNMYYQGNDASGSLWHILWNAGDSFGVTGTSVYWSAWHSSYSQDLHSTVNIIPSFVDYAGGDYNVTTSNMSGDATGLPDDVKAYTMDGEVREATSIGMNNKK